MLIHSFAHNVLLNVDSNLHHKNFHLTLQQMWIVQSNHSKPFCILFMYSQFFLCIFVKKPSRQVVSQSLYHISTKHMYYSSYSKRYNRSLFLKQHSSLEATSQSSTPLIVCQTYSTTFPYQQETFLKIYASTISNETYARPILSLVLENLHHISRQGKSSTFNSFILIKVV